MPETLNSVLNWANENQGVLSILMFVVTIVFGWASGILSALRRKPKFKITSIDGPTFSCTFTTGEEQDGFEVHRTCIAIYLSIANIGSAPSSIENISVGYHWSLLPYSWKWLKYSLGWYWIPHQTVALEEFQVKLGTTIKVYPFLMQRSAFGHKAETFLDVGRSVNGVVYFEQRESWGGCFPASRGGKVQLKVRIRDVFGNAHDARIAVPSVSLEQARKYNPSFGRTLVSLQQVADEYGV